VDYSKVLLHSGMLMELSQQAQTLLGILMLPKQLLIMYLVKTVEQVVVH